MSQRVLLCQRNFVQPISDGFKRHTMRRWPKRVPKIGDTLSLRYWQGTPRRSAQVVFGKATLQGMQKIQLQIVRVPSNVIGSPSISMTLLAIATSMQLGWLEYSTPRKFYGEEMRLFALADGFKTVQEMATWFAMKYPDETEMPMIVYQWHDFQPITIK